MFYYKKKHGKHEDDKKRQEEEHDDIDLDYAFLLGRIRFDLTREELDFMTWGEWLDMFHAYRIIWNFETKRSLYADIEAENEEYTRTHRPIDSVMDL